MKLTQRQRAERASKYHFSKLRPTIFRVPPNKQPCKKGCLCKVCRAYYKALEEAALAAEKERELPAVQGQARVEVKGTHENHADNSILNSNQNNRALTEVSTEDVC